MPMLAAEIASTTAKPSITLERKRRVGSLNDIDCGQIRPDNPTSNPRLFQRHRIRERGLPDLVPKTKAEWIRGRKLKSARWTYPTAASQSDHPEGGSAY